MKKAIISAALMATAALASAQVTVYGRLNATVDSTKTGATTVNSMINDTSRIGFRITEDLGRGLSARAVIETSINSNDPAAGSDTQLGNRQSTVGIDSKLGSIDLGRNVHGVFTTVASGDSFGALYGSIASDVHNLRGNRLGNAVFARFSPVQGVAVGVDRSHTATGAEATVYSATATVAGIAVGAARFEQGNERSTVASAGLRRGNTGLFYSYSDNNGATVSKGHLVGVSQKLGAVTAKASYGRTDRNVNAYNVGAEYAFSKRTDLLVSYRNVDAAGTTADVRQVGVGITHRF
jgi:predicted porin